MTTRTRYIILWLPLLLLIILGVFKICGYEWEHIESHQKNELPDYYDNLTTGSRKLRYIKDYKTIVKNEDFPITGQNSYMCYNKDIGKTTRIQWTLKP